LPDRHLRFIGVLNKVCPIGQAKQAKGVCTAATAQQTAITAKRAQV